MFKTTGKIAPATAGNKGGEAMPQRGAWCLLRTSTGEREEHLVDCDCSGIQDSVRRPRSQGSQASQGREYGHLSPQPLASSGAGAPSAAPLPAERRGCRSVCIPGGDEGCTDTHVDSPCGRPRTPSPLDVGRCSPTRVCGSESTAPRRHAGRSPLLATLISPSEGRAPSTSRRCDHRSHPGRRRTRRLRCEGAATGPRPRGIAPVPR